MFFQSSTWIQRLEMLLRALTDAATSDSSPKTIPAASRIHKYYGGTSETVYGFLSSEFDVRASRDGIGTVVVIDAPISCTMLWLYPS